VKRHYLNRVSASVEYMEKEMGYTVTILGRAKPALPTEAGTVIRVKTSGHGWVYERGSHKTWYSTDGTMYSDAELAELVNKYGPDYEVLVPKK
jgi:hypothetical protein